MNRLASMLALLATAALMVACAGESHRGSTELARDISSARAELTRHHDAVNTAFSLEQLSGEVRTHDGTMDDVMADMSDHMDRMCSGGGLDRMMGMMEGMEVEMGIHRAALESAGDLQAARSTCAEHMDAMSGMLDTMHESMREGSCMGMW